MGIDDFSDLLTQSVTIEPYSSSDGYGGATYGAAVTYKARVVGKQQLVKAISGQDKVSMFTVYLKSNAAIDSRSRITLPADYVPNTPPILAVGLYPDEDGIHHTQIYL